MRYLLAIVFAMLMSIPVHADPIQIVSGGMHSSELGAWDTSGSFLFADGRTLSFASPFGYVSGGGLDQPTIRISMTDYPLIPTPPKWQAVFYISHDPIFLNEIPHTDPVAFAFTMTGAFTFLDGTTTDVFGQGEIRLSWTIEDRPYLNIGYVFESDPTPLVSAPEVPTLALLPLGLMGILIVRKRQTVP